MQIIAVLVSCQIVINCRHSVVQFQFRHNNCCKTAKLCSTFTYSMLWRRRRLHLFKQARKHAMNHDYPLLRLPPFLFFPSFPSSCFSSSCSFSSSSSSTFSSRFSDDQHHDNLHVNCDDDHHDHHEHHQNANLTVTIRLIIFSFTFVSGCLCSLYLMSSALSCTNTIA